MTRILAALAVSLVLSSAASAGTYGDGLKMAAQNGSITPHGIWDAR